MQNLLWKKLHSDAKIPEKAFEDDAGYDLSAYCLISDTKKREAAAGHSVSIAVCREAPLMVHTGIAVAIPPGYVGLLTARSSLSKRGILIANSVGVIDSGYRGELIIPLILIGDIYFMTSGQVSDRIWHGERIAQLVILPLPNFTSEEVLELPPTERGPWGFGSTGI